MIWLGFLTDKNPWLPIPPEPVNPTCSYKSFISDAAGLSIDGDYSCGPGVASVGFNENGEIMFAQSISWFHNMIVHKRDSKGVRFGDKSTTLEMIGLLLPFLSIPNKLRNQHVVVFVDNLACVHGWESKSVKGDTTASILLRAPHLIEAFLGSVIHVRHAPRKLNWESTMVDRMSRVKSVSQSDLVLLSSFSLPGVSQALLAWLKSPNEDWNLSFRLLKHVCDVCI